MLRPHRLTIIFLSLTASLGLAGAIKVWASGSTLSSADLNSNFAHIHNLMVGGHGARLVDADVSPTAAIAQSKISGLSTIVAAALGDGGLSPRISAIEDGGATKDMAARAWVAISTPCTPAVCAETMITGRGVTSISHTATGTWTITLSSTRPAESDGGTARFAPFVTANGGSSVCDATPASSSTVGIVCYVLSTHALGDVSWSMMMLDEN